jgi:hypothetical protein
MSKDSETVIKSLPLKKSPGSDGFPAEFLKTSQEEVISVFLKLFQKKN